MLLGEYQKSNTKYFGFFMPFWDLSATYLMDQRLIRNVRDHFLEQFQTSPIVIFSPGRINLIGEHTDYNDGDVFPAAIDMGIVMTIQESREPTFTCTANEKYTTRFSRSIDSYQVTLIDGTRLIP